MVNRKLNTYYRTIILRVMTLLVMLLLVILSINGIVSSRKLPESDSISSETENQPFNRNHCQNLPENWRIQNIEKDITITIPPAWYFIKPDESYIVESKADYIITDKRNLESYQDWAAQEYIRIVLSIYDNNDLLYREHSKIDYLNKRYGSIGRKPIKFMEQAYAINGHSVIRFLINDNQETKSSIQEILMAQLDDHQVVEVVVNIREDTPSEIRSIYEDRGALVVDCLNIE